MSKHRDSVEPTRGEPDESRARHIHTVDARLNRLLNQQPERCATVDEYAASSGMDTAEVMAAFDRFLDDGTLALEFVGSDVFILTAPTGRPQPPTAHQVAPNLWERLRMLSDVYEAHRAWQLLRALERQGWSLRVPTREEAHATSRPTLLEARVGSRMVPLVIDPDPSMLMSPMGVLAEHARMRHSAVAISCAPAGLDAATTAVRRYLLEGRGAPLHVLLLEAPLYNPVLLSPGDAGVLPRSITRQSLEDGEISL